MAKYDDLHNYLKARAGQQQVALTFRDIERILGTRLPDSARTERTWWANTHGHVSAHAWLTAGFRVVEINMQTERVVFGRDAPAPVVPAGPTRAALPRATSGPPPLSPAPRTTRQVPPASTTTGIEGSITAPPTWKPLVVLAERRPIFHSEADFQFELAWTLREMGYRDIRLEKPVRPTEGKRIYIDIFAVEPGGRRLAIELKYWTRAFKQNVKDEDFDLANQAAQDLSRYDYWKDVTRVEHLIEDRRADAGYVVALTLDPTFLRRSDRDTVDAAFRLHEGRELRAGETLGWGEDVGDGTKKNRAKVLRLDGSYVVRWARYSEEGPMWCLVLALPPRDVRARPP